MVINKRKLIEKWIVKIVITFCTTLPKLPEIHASRLEYPLNNKDLLFIHFKQQN